MDIAQIPLVNKLVGDYQRIRAALTVLDAGGHVTSVTIASKPPEPPPQPPEPRQPPPMPPMPGMTNVPVDSSPELVAAIKKSLEDRRAAIAKELQGMGVTGE